jgi:hypothetical protein
MSPFGELNIFGEMIVAEKKKELQDPGDKQAIWGISGF